MWEGRLRAYLDDGLRTYDLNDLIVPGLGWTVVSAQDINKHGQVLALAHRSDGKRRGVVLEPVPDYNSLSWLLAGTALTGLGRWARRRKGTERRG
jgi:hypothetical protein